MCNKVVAFRVDVMKKIGNINATLMMSQIMYWSEKSKDAKGWFYKTQKEWEAEIGLSKRCQQSARSKLKALGLLEERIESCPPKVHFRVNKERLKDLLSVDNLSTKDENQAPNEPVERTKTIQSEEQKEPIDRCKKSQSVAQNDSIEGSEKGKSIYIDYNIDYTETTTETTHRDAQVRDVVEKKKNTCTVFDHWKKIMNHPKAKLDEKRRKLIRQALKSGYSESDLCQAIDGCAVTPHNIGQNDRGQRFDGLHIILRNAEQIDRFMANADNPPMLRNKSQIRESQNMQVVNDFIADLDSGAIVI